MNNDIVPPKPRSKNVPKIQPILPDNQPNSLNSLAGAHSDSTPEVQSVMSSPKNSPNNRWHMRKKILFTSLTLALVAILAAIAIFMYSLLMIQPINKEASSVKVKIENNTSTTQIGRLLKENNLVRDEWLFTAYTKLTGTASRLKAGTYHLSAAESLPQLVEHLTKGTNDMFTLTFYPGATLRDTTKKDDQKKTDVSTILRRAGYDKKEIEVALAKQYQHPLFQDKPASADLEGYVYGETYTFAPDTTVEEILRHTFDEYYAKIKKYDLIVKFKQQGLTLYQGITLASIIQREVYSQDMKQVAQVFYSRMKINMPLGSDVTYQYAADKMGLERSINLDSPYNTRRYNGLPPGPISVPGVDALIAAAEPASGNYLYFLSGDDNITYFARTEVEHQANIDNHCKEKCKII